MSYSKLTMENTYSNDVFLEEREDCKSFIEDYKLFLNKSKTERETVIEIEEEAKEQGFESLDEKLERKEEIKKGDKIYYKNKEKSIVLFVIGEDSILDGVNIIASHVDSPRIDLKPNPIYEEDGLAFFKTHYYGGIKKFQWVTIPLSLHGKIIRGDGKELSISIGEGENDPVFFITDLLPHLAKDQMTKTLLDAIPGEGLNVLAGSDKVSGDYKDSVKLKLLSILNEKYGIVEEDLISAELEIVPSGKSKDVGLDRSMIAGYGQDDRVCVYTSMKAIFEVKNPKRTSVAIFMDKEEVGSMGNTGMEGMFFKLSLGEIVNSLEGKFSELDLNRIFSKSFALSADTVAAFDPNFPDVLERNNSSFLGQGVSLIKYTGIRGKYDTNDANSEYMWKIINMFKANNIVWQIGELGKVDQGGGGTIAYILGNYGIDIIDCGIALLNVHAPYEIGHKGDIYMGKKAYDAFYKLY